MDDLFLQLRKSTEFESARTVFSEVLRKVVKFGTRHTHTQRSAMESPLPRTLAVDFYKTRTKIRKEVQNLASIAAFGPDNPIN